MPYTFFLYVISYLDRANIGYAALQMNKELALTSEAFGFAAGIFFIGYFLFEVPSNVALNKYGSRLWISRILLTWGILAIRVRLRSERRRSSTSCASCSVRPRPASSPVSSST